MGMLGESSRLSLTTWGLSTKAAFGAVSKGGVGIPVFDVVHSGAGPWAFVAVQPAGSAGGVTPSKCLAERRRRVRARGGPASRTSVARSRRRAAAPAGGQQRVPIAAPPTRERATARLGAGRPTVGRRVVGHRRGGRARRSLASEAPELAARNSAPGSVRRGRHGWPSPSSVRRDAVVPGQIDRRRRRRGRPRRRDGRR